MSNLLEQSSKQLKQFLFSQYFGDGFRITAGMVIPFFIAYQFGFAQAGVALSLGALSVSIPDHPGPPAHRRNAMLITLGLSTLMAIVAGVVSHYSWATAILIAISCFVFSMLNIFGARAASIGVSVLVIMVLGIDSNNSLEQTLTYAGYLGAGGSWYLLLSVLTQQLLPHRPAEQALGECIMKVADFMKLKADFYREETDLDTVYQKLLEQQVEVNQHQENVRELLFRTRKLLRDTSPTGRKLLLTFVDLVDVYEQIHATHYRYADIRKQFHAYDVLPYFHQFIVQLGEELEHIGEGFHNHQTVQPIHEFLPRLNIIKQKVDAIEAKGVSVWVLKRILINLRNISSRIHRMYEYDTRQGDFSEQRNNELRKFVTPQLIDWKLFFANLSPASNHFRHAARVAIVCLLAYVFTQTVSEGPHSYWILLTIIVILKPGFSLTKQRNIERMIGTVAGGLIGLGVLTFFPTEAARFAFLIVFMLLTFSFIRLRYVVGVLFMTPYILIVFSFTTSYNDLTVAWERIIDTFIGASAAFVGSYFVFPSWESYQLKTAITNMLKANAEYLQKVSTRSSLNPMSQSQYRLARKALYVNTAHLTTAFQRMLSEPKSKQTQADLLYRFVVLNHQFSSYLATLSYQLQLHEQLSDEQVKQLRAIWFTLKEAYEKVSGEPLADGFTSSLPDAQHPWISNELLLEIHQTAHDMKKIALEFKFKVS
jgi:uncharacterized membrane protein (TIGR01666 family)